MKKWMPLILIVGLLFVGALVTPVVASDTYTASSCKEDDATQYPYDFKKVLIIVNVTDYETPDPTGFDKSEAELRFVLKESYSYHLGVHGYPNSNPILKFYYYDEHLNKVHVIDPLSLEPYKPYVVYIDLQNGSIAVYEYDDGWTKVRRGNFAGGDMFAFGRWVYVRLTVGSKPLWDHRVAFDFILVDYGDGWVNPDDLGGSEGVVDPIYDPETGELVGYTLILDDGDETFYLGSFSTPCP